jgi:hypothetical protein
MVRMVRTARALVRVMARSTKVLKRSWRSKNGVGRRVGKRGVVGTNKVKRPSECPIGRWPLCEALTPIASHLLL